MSLRGGGRQNAHACHAVCLMPLARAAERMRACGRREARECQTSFAFCAIRFVLRVTAERHAARLLGADIGAVAAALLMMPRDMARERALFDDADVC